MLIMVFLPCWKVLMFENKMPPWVNQTQEAFRFQI